MAYINDPNNPINKGFPNSGYSNQSNKQEYTQLELFKMNNSQLKSDIHDIFDYAKKELDDFHKTATKSFYEISGSYSKYMIQELRTVDEAYKNFSAGWYLITTNAYKDAFNKRIKYDQDYQKYSSSKSSSNDNNNKSSKFSSNNQSSNNSNKKYNDNARSNNRYNINNMSYEALNSRLNKKDYVPNFSMKDLIEFLRSHDIDVNAKLDKSQINELAKEAYNSKTDEAKKSGVNLSDNAKSKMYNNIHDNLASAVGSDDLNKTNSTIEKVGDYLGKTTLNLGGMIKGYIESGINKYLSTYDQVYNGISLSLDMDHKQYDQFINTSRDTINKMGMNNVISINTLQENLAKTSKEGLSEQQSQTKAMGDAVANVVSPWLDTNSKEYDQLYRMQGKNGSTFEKLTTGLASIAENTDGLKAFSDNGGLNDLISKFSYNLTQGGYNTKQITEVLSDSTKVMSAITNAGLSPAATNDLETMFSNMMAGSEGGIATGKFNPLQIAAMAQNGTANLQAGQASGSQMLNTAKTLFQEYSSFNDTALQVMGINGSQQGYAKALDQLNKLSGKNLSDKELDSQVQKIMKSASGGNTTTADQQFDTSNENNASSIAQALSVVPHPLDWIGGLLVASNINSLFGDKISGGISGGFSKVAEKFAGKGATETAENAAKAAGDEASSGVNAAKKAAEASEAAKDAGNVAEDASAVSKGSGIFSKFKDVLSGAKDIGSSVATKGLELGKSALSKGSELFTKLPSLSDVGSTIASKGSEVLSKIPSLSELGSKVLPAASKVGGLGFDFLKNGGPAAIVGAGIDATLGATLESKNWLGKKEGSSAPGRIASGIAGALAGTGPGVGEGSAGSVALNIAGGALKGGSIGAMFGGPIGAAIGAAVGGGLSAVGGKRVSQFFDSAFSLSKNLATKTGKVFSNIGSNVSKSFSKLPKTIDNVFNNIKKSKPAQDVNKLFTDIFNPSKNTKNKKSSNTSIFGDISSLVGDTVNDGLSLLGLNNKKSATKKKTNGSHASGLGFVPFNGYSAILHEGEAVLPKSLASIARGLSNAKSSNNELSKISGSIKNVAKASISSASSISSGLVNSALGNNKSSESSKDVVDAIQWAEGRLEKAILSLSSNNIDSKKSSNTSNSNNQSSPFLKKVKTNYNSSVVNTTPSYLAFK